MKCSGRSFTPIAIIINRLSADLHAATRVEGPVIQTHGLDGCPGSSRRHDVFDSRRAVCWQPTFSVREFGNGATW